MWLIIKNLAAKERKCQGKSQMISPKTQGGLLKRDANDDFDLLVDEHGIEAGAGVAAIADEQDAFLRFAVQGFLAGKKNQETQGSDKFRGRRNESRLNHGLGTLGFQFDLPPDLDGLRVPRKQGEAGQEEMENLDQGRPVSIQASSWAKEMPV